MEAGSPWFASLFFCSPLGTQEVPNHRQRYRVHVKDKAFHEPHYIARFASLQVLSCSWSSKFQKGYRGTGTPAKKYYFSLPGQTVTKRSLHMASYLRYLRYLRFTGNQCLVLSSSSHGGAPQRPSSAALLGSPTYQYLAP